jgi:hypothetical protein
MRYLKFLGMPYALEDMREVEVYPGEPLAEEKYYQRIEDSL